MLRDLGVCHKHRLWYDTKPKVEAREHLENMKRDHRRTGTGNATQFLVHLLASLGLAPLPAGTGKNTQDQPDLHPKPDRSTCSTASAHASDAQYLALIHTRSSHNGLGPTASWHHIKAGTAFHLRVFAI